MATQDEEIFSTDYFKAAAYQRDDGTVLELSGELDVSTAGKLREVLMQLPLDDGLTLRVDLCGIGFLGSTGVGLLVSTCKRIREFGGNFSVTCDDSQARQVFEIAGLLDYLSVRLPEN